MPKDFKGTEEYNIFFIAMRDVVKKNYSNPVFEHIRVVRMKREQEHVEEWIPVKRAEKDFGQDVVAEWAINKTVPFRLLQGLSPDTAIPFPQNSEVEISRFRKSIIVG